MEEVPMGVIVGNRGFFADEICKEAREEMLSVLKEAGVKPIVLSEEEEVYGSLETREAAKKCAELFKEHKEEIKGVVVTLPNFGSEKPIAEALKMSDLNVPVLVQAFPDEADKMGYENRRDSFCGKISVCNNLRQYGIDYTLPQLHTVAPDTEEFKEDLNKFIGVCKVVNALKNARVGIIGPRPADFNTVRYSEKILEHNGISVEPIGLIDILNEAKAVGEKERKENLKRVTSYIDTEGVPEEALNKIAGFLPAVENWIEDNNLDAIAVQCWDALQNTLGIMPCTVMSLLSNTSIPSACEADVMGALSMLALQAASDKPSGLADWNNNFGTDPEKAILFHCGNWAKDIYSGCKMDYAEILGSVLGQENTYGAIYGKIKEGPITFARITSDDVNGELKAYVAEGEVTEEQLDVNGSWGPIKVPNLQKLLNHICNNGFEHHVGINLSSVTDILEEAFGNYLGWEVYNHNREN